MPPRLNLLGASRSLARRSSPSIAILQPRIIQISLSRGFADGKDSQPARGPNQDVLGHVSEEAVDVGKVTGEKTPDLGQGTPVQEVCVHIYLTWPFCLQMKCMLTEPRRCYNAMKKAKKMLPKSSKRNKRSRTPQKRPHLKVSRH